MGGGGAISHGNWGGCRTAHELTRLPTIAEVDGTGHPGLGWNGLATSHLRYGTGAGEDDEDSETPQAR